MFVDTLASSVADSRPTHAMLSKDNDGEDDFWLVDPVDGAVRALDDDYESPMLTDSAGNSLCHTKGDRVVDCYFWYPYGSRNHRKYYLENKTVIPIPTHMFLSVEGFVMPTAPKPKRGAHHEYVKRLPDDVYDAIQEQLPEPLTDEYM